MVGNCDAKWAIMAVIYGVSNHKKLTSKQIGLGLALHQQTRLENLVQLFNAETHTVVIMTVDGIDNAIAKYVLTYLSQMDKQSDNIDKEGVI